MDYADVIYNKLLNHSFKEKLQKFQYSAALIIMGAIKDTSWERGLESHSDRRWYRKLVFFYIIVKGVAPSYLQSYLLPDDERTYNTRSILRNTIKIFPTQEVNFSCIFFPYRTKKSNQLNYDFK